MIQDAAMLWVEDQLELVEESVEILLRAPDLRIEFAFAVDIGTAVAALSTRRFDVVVLDTMLPAHPGFPCGNEGCELARLIRSGKFQKGDVGTPSDVAIVFCSSRIQHFALERLNERNTMVIERSRADPFEVAKRIRAMIQGTREP